MFAQLTSRTNALRLFAAAAVVMIVEYIAVFYAPTEGGTGIYVLSSIGAILWIYVFCFFAMVVSAVVSSIRSRSLSHLGALVLIIVILLLPLFPAISIPQILRKHSTTLRTPNHVYQLAQDILPHCLDTFDTKTYKCYSLVFLYQCDSLGFLCNIQAHDLDIYHDTPLRLQLVDNDIQIVGDGDTVVYRIPA
jgi:hypothetical protein